VKLFVALVLAALLVVGLAKQDTLEFWAEIDSDGPVDAMAFSQGLPSGLGTGPRTADERVWIGRMNWECRARNKQIVALRRSAGRGPVNMEWYTNAALEVRREYRRRANRHDVPSSYAGEAEWLSKVDAAREEAIPDIFFAADGMDLDALQRAVAANERIHADTKPGLRKIGLRDCVGFSV
jgi:hypothetical protein